MWQGTEEAKNFGYFNNKVKEVTKAGAEVGIVQGQYFSWFVPPSGYTGDLYYIYRGRYNNLPSGSEDTCSYCATVIVYPFYRNISKNQVSKPQWLTVGSYWKTILEKIVAN